MSDKQPEKTGEEQNEDLAKLDDIAPDAGEADQVTGGGNVSQSGESKPLQIKIG